MEETITIPLSEYKRLQRSELKLECLEGAGVDNWQGWDEAMSMLREAIAAETKEGE